MISLYLAVVLVNGKIQGTVGDGVYTNPEQCYFMTQFPKDDPKEEIRCLKVKGDYVNFKIIEGK
jgi:hypothetical protein